MEVVETTSPEPPPPPAPAAALPQATQAPEPVSTAIIEVAETGQQPTPSPCLPTEQESETTQAVTAAAAPLPQPPVTVEEAAAQTAQAPPPRMEQEEVAVEAKAEVTRTGEAEEKKGQAIVPAARFSSVLGAASLKKLAWYLDMATATGGGELDQHLAALPLPQPEMEAQTLVAFARLTRQFATGEDGDELDEAADQKRLKLYSAQQSEYAKYAAMHPHHHLQQQHQMHLMNSAASRKRKRTAPVETGRQVAAKIDGGPEWNLMTVRRYTKKTRTYLLEDADEQVEKKEEVEVPKELVLPLSCAEYSFGPFPVGARVLAMYPGTTSFYAANVTKCIKRVPKRPASSATSSAAAAAAAAAAKQSVMYDYEVQYDEDEVDPNGNIVTHAIHGEYVVEAPE